MVPKAVKRHCMLMPLIDYPSSPIVPDPSDEPITGQSHSMDNGPESVVSELALQVHAHDTNHDTPCQGLRQAEIQFATPAHTQEYLEHRNPAQCPPMPSQSIEEDVQGPLPSPMHLDSQLWTSMQHPPPFPVNRRRHRVTTTSHGEDIKAFTSEQDANRLIQVC